MSLPTTPRAAAVSALVIVDMQVGFLVGENALPEADRLINNLSSLLTSARHARALIIHLQNDGAPGAIDEPHTPSWKLYFGAENSPTEVIIRKTTDDGFDTTLLGSLLQEYGVKRFVLGGLLSEMCVSATARTALSKGYNVIMPQDAHGTYHLGEISASVVARVAEHALGDSLELVSCSSGVSFKAANINM